MFGGGAVPNFTYPFCYSSAPNSHPCPEPLECHLLLVSTQRLGAPGSFAGVQGPLESEARAGRKDGSKDCHEVVPTVCGLAGRAWQ